MSKKISMYRKLLGYTSGDRRQPIFAPMPGALVTQAFILCSQCRKAISGTMGPRTDAWCIPCTNENVIAVAKEKKAARKKAAAEKRMAAAVAAAEKKKAEEDEEGE